MNVKPFQPPKTDRLNEVFSVQINDLDDLQFLRSVYKTITGSATLSKPVQFCEWLSIRELTKRDRLKDKLLKTLTYKLQTAITSINLTVRALTLFYHCQPRI
jgi:hypothetical protein